MGRTARWWLTVFGVLAILVAAAIGSGATTGQSAAPSTTRAPSTSITSPTSDLTPPTATPPAPAAPAASSSTTSPSTSTLPTTVAPPAAAAPVDRLTVALPDPAVAPYRRAAFGNGWDYDPATGCNTRELVLIDESLSPPVLRERCHPVSGSWRSAYDGVTITDPTALEIDHLVPLADAWRSGAASWTDEQRRAFANDRTDPATLIAVTGRANRSKSDRTPDQWLPPDAADRCDYARAWVGVKLRWQFSVTAPEKATLVQILGGC